MTNQALWEIPLKRDWSVIASGSGIPIVEKTSGRLVCVFARHGNSSKWLALARETVRLNNQAVQQRKKHATEKARDARLRAIDGDY